VVWPEVAEAEAVTEQEQAPVQERALEQQQARERMALAKASLARRSFDSRYHRNP
jgi:hypothetical protein